MQFLRFGSACCFLLRPLLWFMATRGFFGSPIGHFRGADTATVSLVGFRLSVGYVVNGAIAKVSGISDMPYTYEKRMTRCRIS